MVKCCKMPKEMMVHVLSRLPPKSLVRFKCVHKSWSALINNSSFVGKHLQLYNQLCSSTSIFLKRSVKSRTGTNNEEILLSFFNLRKDNGDDDDLNPIVEDFHLPPSIGILGKGPFIEVEPGESIYIVGHCEGIICLIIYTGDLVLCNPATKEFKILPESCLQDTTSEIVGFGYDPKANDFKIVNIGSCGEESYGERLVINPPKAEVYTPSTDSWRNITIDYLETETTNFWPDVFHEYFKGICYWLGHEQNKEFIDTIEQEIIRQVIVSFDMSNERFHIILLPDRFYIPSVLIKRDLHIAVWNESIVLFIFQFYGSSYEEYSFDIWVKDEYGDTRGSWTKHITIEPIVGLALPLTFWKSDEFIMVAPDGHIVSYNLHTQKYRHLPLFMASIQDILKLLFVCIV
ncbi:F-box/kelch-repeat protein At3g06240-like [Rosa rugosa]|uniref:F-box/kelch-repeat protein At3g06240-like n=1 Tax=Rosa rugosa TaxID=74645 RepID=UPI002B4077AF|nr:F-box/kelch-repeat protein At3g06240-like [Rosa rugosa]